MLPTASPQPAVEPHRTFADGGFADRRQDNGQSPGVERRQFAATRDSISPDVNELAEAIDDYKLKNRRRFITVDELHGVITGLGYSR